MNAPKAILAALGAALLFGASTPFAKLLVGQLPPVLLASLLYLGSGLGLAGFRLLRDRGFAPSGLRSSQWPWLLGAIVSGGVAGPVLLMLGLMHIAAADAALLLNLEPVATVLLAWIVFREHAGRRVVLGMALIIAGSLILTGLGPAHAASRPMLGGNVAIALACVCWGLDNNLTRKVSEGDALFLAAIKGLIAGVSNLLLAIALGASWPAAAWIGSAMLIGLLGYGISLVLFVVALRGLGAARAGAYFATAPFLGTVIALALFHAPVLAPFWICAAAMAVGVWLHLTEQHEHDHRHEAMTHLHAHAHDEHHRHTHDFSWAGEEPHTHEHVHASLWHRHSHFPDLHHRHRH